MRVCPPARHRRCIVLAVRTYVSHRVFSAHFCSAEYNDLFSYYFISFSNPASIKQQYLNSNRFAIQNICFARRRRRWCHLLQLMSCVNASPSVPLAIIGGDRQVHRPPEPCATMKVKVYIGLPIPVRLVGGVTSRRTFAKSVGSLMCCAHKGADCAPHPLSKSPTQLMSLQRAIILT